MLRVGLIGCGAVGAGVARAFTRGRIPLATLAGIADAFPCDASRRTAAEAGCPLLSDVGELLKLRLHLVIEAASQDAVRSCAARVINAGVDLMVVSVGALADPLFASSLAGMCAHQGRRLYIPSGAVGGIDILRAAAACGIQECRLTSIKPPKALAGNPFVAGKGINLDELREPFLLYEGPAAEAVRLFPQNVNVAATVSLAGIGVDSTMVRIVVDPSAAANTHEISIRSGAGEATIRLVNLPSPDNPKTSYLAGLSVIAALQRICSPIQLGS